MWSEDTSTKKHWIPSLWSVGWRWKVVRQMELEGSCDVNLEHNDAVWVTVWIQSGVTASHCCVEECGFAGGTAGESGATVSAEAQKTVALRLMTLYQRESRSAWDELSNSVFSYLLNWTSNKNKITINKNLLYFCYCCTNMCSALLSQQGLTWLTDVIFIQNEIFSPTLWVYWVFICDMSLVNVWF